MREPEDGAGGGIVRFSGFPWSYTHTTHIHTPQAKCARMYFCVHVYVCVRAVCDDVPHCVDDPFCNGGDKSRLPPSPPLNNRSRATSTDREAPSKTLFFLTCRGKAVRACCIRCFASLLHVDHPLSRFSCARVSDRALSPDLRTTGFEMPSDVVGEGRARETTARSRRDRNSVDR